MKIIGYLTLLLLLILVCISCQREITINLAPDDQEKNEETEQPVIPSESDNLSEVLEFENAKVVKNENLPQSSAPAEAPIVSNFDKSISYTAGSKVILPASVTATHP